jgi:hypothetical protein
MSSQDCVTPEIADSNDAGGVSLPSNEVHQQDIHTKSHHQPPQQEEVPNEAQQQEVQQENTPDEFQPEPLVHIINGAH